MAYNNAIANKYTEPNADIITDMTEELEKTYGDGNVSVTESNGTYTVTINGKEYTIGETKTGSLPTGEGTTPYLPSDDFKQVEGTNLSNRLVIEDSKGNQYVWVEVPNDGSGPVYTSVASTTEKSDEYYDAIYNELEAYVGDYAKGSASQTNTGWTEEWYDRCNMTWDGENSYALVKNVGSSSYYNTAKEYYESKGKKLYTTSECTTEATTYSSSGLYVKIEGEDDVLLQDTQGCGLTYKEYDELYKTMLESVYKNGGFWIGRYEVGDSTITTNIENGTNLAGRTSSSGTTNTAVIKANQIPYTYVKCYEAQEIAERFSNGGYKSSLPFGIQWDLVMKYLEVKGNMSYEQLAGGDGVGSTKWGNYSNNLWNITNTNSKSSTDYGDNWVNGAYGSKEASKSILLSTGADDIFSKMNIYDLAGNVWEWTLEHATSRSNSPCASRGGHYGSTGSYDPASSRVNDRATLSSFVIGFRPTLY